MTQQQEPTNKVAIEPPQSEPTQSAPAKSGKPALAVASISILIALGLSAGLYWHGHQVVETIITDQQAQIDTLKSQLQQQVQQQLTQYSATIKSEQSSIIAQLESEKSQITQLDQKLSTNEDHYQSIEEQLQDLDVGDLDQWRLFEAQYLIHLAGRKLWLEQDMSASKSLLDSADKSIAYLKDPQLLPLRRAIVNDINAIDAVDDVDTDGIVLKLGSLIDQIDTLSLAAMELPEVLEEMDMVPNGDITNWRTNLYKSWIDFSDNFITVRRRDGQVEALIEPRHTWYLQQNIKLALQQAQVAATSQQTAQFIACLERANKWIGQYFDNNATAKHIQSSLTDIASQTIITPLPQTISSLSLIDETIKAQQKRLPEEVL